MLARTPRILLSAAVACAVGLAGSPAFAERPVPRHHDDEPPRIEVEVDEEEEPELLPPAVPVPAEGIARAVGLNPMVAAEPFGRIAIDLNLHLSDIDDDLTAFIATPVVQARIPVTDLGMQRSGLEIGVDLPLLWIAPWNDPADQLNSAVGVGNPYLSTHFVQGFEGFSYSAGIGVALPLADEEGTRGPSRALAYEYAIGNRIGHDMWLWTPDRFSVVVPVRVEGLAGRLVVGADAAFAAMVWTGPGAQDTDYVTQFGAELGYQVTAGSTVGVRGLGHWAPTLDAYDWAFAVEPGFRTRLGDTGFMGLRLTLPIDEPFGFAFERGNNWALSLTFGTQI